MKKILLHATSFESFWAHYSVFHDQDFKDRLRFLGYDLFYSNQTRLDEADIILFLEATSIGLHRFGITKKLKHVTKLLLGKDQFRSDDIYKECKKKKLYPKTALLVAEGNLHLPENHQRKLEKMFPVILTWNDNMIDGKKFCKYKIPQPVRWPELDKTPFKEKKLLVNISANKYHSNKIELYSARRDSIQYFEKRFGEQFDLYGIGWNKPVTLGQRFLKFPYPVYSSYKGVIENKSTIFPKYRFALCYENTQLPGYITEKIFDCLRSDCVPVYLGAQNVYEYIPKETFIDRRQFSSDEQLADFILDVDEDKYRKYQESINEYLSSHQFSSFLAPSFAENIVNVLEGKSKKSNDS